MLGAHDDLEQRQSETVKSFDTITLLTGNWKPQRQSSVCEDDLDTAWSNLLAKCTPEAATQLPTQSMSIHETWSPSLETPKATNVSTTGISSLDSRMNKVSVTSPGLLFPSTPKQSLLSDEDDFCKSPIVHATNNNNNNLMMGFTTGGGKKIKSPSKEAVERSNNLMMMDLGFTTGSGRKIDPPKDAHLTTLSRTVEGESPKRKSSQVSVLDSMDEEYNSRRMQPTKLSKLHAELELHENQGELTWKEALKCSPCCDVEMTLLSGIPNEMCTLTSEKAADFCFSSIGFSPWDVGWAYEDLAGLDGIKKELITFEWVQNHYRWIVWKAASLARRFPKLLSSFNPNEILRQLHERYLSEFVKCKRSALKLICERDDVPGKPMVLMIARVLSEKEWELSDGWYSLKALVDEPLAALVKSKRLLEGYKIITCGATLSAGEPTPVLEAFNSTLRLSIFFNSTRRARWFQKFGYQRTHFLVKTIRSDGGRIAGVECTIMRRYPQCYSIEDSLSNRQVYTQREYDRLLDKFGSSPSQSQVELFKNSRTTTFVRLLVNHNTLLTVWCPEMIADIREGDIVRVFGAMPSKHASDGNMAINTVKGTVIVKIKSGTSSRKIYTELPNIYDNWPKSFDFEGLVEEPPDQANNRTMSLFLQDTEERQLCILVPKRHYETFPRLHPKQIITLYDLTFLHYDRQKGFPVYTFTERSDFKLKR